MVTIEGITILWYLNMLAAWDDSSAICTRMSFIQIMHTTVAFTSEPFQRVGTGGVIVTVVGVKLTFINLDNFCTRAVLVSEPFVTTTCKTVLGFYKICFFTILDKIFQQNIPNKNKNKTSPVNSIYTSRIVTAAIGFTIICVIITT